MAKNGRPISVHGTRAHSVGSHAGATLYVPSYIFETIPPDERFICELVEEGILFRRLPKASDPPSWAVIPPASNGRTLASDLHEDR